MKKTKESHNFILMLFITIIFSIMTNIDTEYMLLLIITFGILSIIRAIEANEK